MFSRNPRWRRPFELGRTRPRENVLVPMLPPPLAFFSQGGAAAFSRRSKARVPAPSGKCGFKKSPSPLEVEGSKHRHEQGTRARGIRSKKRQRLTTSAQKYLPAAGAPGYDVENILWHIISFRDPFSKNGLEGFRAERGFEVPSEVLIRLQKQLLGSSSSCATTS